LSKPGQGLCSISSWQFERRYGYYLLARHLERLSAGGDNPHVRRSAKDFGHELSGVAEKVFAVVDNEKQTLLP
jgi:hypothetical protein